MTTERSVTVRLRVDNSGFIRGLAEASAAARAFERSLSGKSTGFGGSLDKAGTSADAFAANLRKAGIETENLTGLTDSAARSTEGAAKATDHFAESQARYARGSKAFATAIRNNDRDSRSFAKSLNAGGGRMEFLVQSALALGPALVPIGAVALPALAGLGTELGIAAGAAGVAVLAFQGIGTALKAVNQQALQPTDAHLAAMNLALANLGPAGQQFVQFLQQARPLIQGLQQTAQTGLFPGLEAGLTEMESQLPAVRNLIQQVSQSLGGLAQSAGSALSGPEATDFLDFLSTTGVQILESTAKAIGHLLQGVAALGEAFGPLTVDFTKGFDNFAIFFRDWATNLPKTQGFQDFIAYLQDAGPAVLEALKALGNAIVQIVQAASGIGLASLHIITLLANAIAAIADSPAGPALLAVAAGISAVSRAMALSNLVAGGTDNLFIKNLRAMPAAALRARAGIGALGIGLGIAASQIDDSHVALKGLTETASDAAIGFSVGGPWGAAIGAGIGLLTAFTGRTEAATAAEAALASETKKLADSGFDKQGNLAKAGIADVVSALKDAGAESDALDLGVPFNQLVVAATGSIGAIDKVMVQVNSVVDQAKAARDAAVAAAASNLDPSKQAALNDEVTRTTAAYISLNAAGQGVKDTLDGQNTAVADARQAWNELRAEGQTTNQVWKEMKSSIDAEASSVREAAAAHNTLADALAQNQEGMIGFRDAVRDAIKGADGFKGSINDQTKAGDAQKLALLQVRDAWRDTTEAAKAAPGAYEAARKKFLHVADVMNVGADAARRLADKWLDLPDPALAAQKAAQHLADQYNKIPKDVRTQLAALGKDATEEDIQDVIDKADDLTAHDKEVILKVIDKASGPINSVKAKLTQLDGNSATVTIFENHRTSEGPQAGPTFTSQPKRKKKASGGEIRGPGGPRGDRIPILASDREFIVNAAAAQANLGLLHAINDGVFTVGGLPGFAGGGAVGQGHSAGAGRRISAEQLSRRALGSDDAASIRDLADALAAMRAEAVDVTQAEGDLREARAEARAVTRDSSSTEKEKAEAERAVSKAEAELSKQRSQLSQATQQWHDVQQQLIEQAVQVQQSILSEGAVTGGEGTSVTVGGILAKIRQAAKDARAFDKNIALLRAEGLDEDVIQQLLAEAGTPAAQAAAANLAAASMRQIRQINRAEGSLERAALHAGQVAVGGGGPAQGVGQGHGVSVRATFTGAITTTDVTKLPRKLEERLMRAYRRAVRT